MEMTSDDNVKQKLLDSLSEEPTMVLSTAYAYAKNYVEYGEDITKAWTTAVQQASILEKVRQKAYVEAYYSCKKDYEARLKADMMSRKAVFEAIDDCNSSGLTGIFCSYDAGERFKEYINKKLPPNVTPKNLCDSCTNYGCEFQSGIVRAECAFYMPPVQAIPKDQDKEFWDKVAEELKPTIKRALEETFEPTKCMNEFVKEESDDNEKEEEV